MTMPIRTGLRRLAPAAIAVGFLMIGMMSLAPVARAAADHLQIGVLIFDKVLTSRRDGAHGSIWERQQEAGILPVSSRDHCAREEADHDRRGHSDHAAILHRRCPKAHGID